MPSQLLFFCFLNQRVDLRHVSLVEDKGVGSVLIPAQEWYACCVADPEWNSMDESMCVFFQAAALTYGSCSNSQITYAQERLCDFLQNIKINFS